MRMCFCLAYLNRSLRSMASPRRLGVCFVVEEGGRGHPQEKQEWLEEEEDIILVEGVLVEETWQFHSRLPLGLSVESCRTSIRA